jgi:hypothetical protein
MPDHAAARARVLLLRRVHGFALIADGIGHILNLRLGLGLRSAKALAKARAK